MKCFRNRLVLIRIKIEKQMKHMLGIELDITMNWICCSFGAQFI
jgi:hypothetical protein